MPKKINNNHDVFSKKLLANKEIAIDFLNEMLSPSLKQHLKLETLVQQQNSYLTAELKESFSDIVWRIETTQKPIKICLLLEHKSYKDQNVVFQILEYLALGYRKQLKAKKELELIIPVVYYHGKDAWEPKFIYDFFGNIPNSFQQYLPNYAFEYINLQALSHEHILSLRNGMLASSLFIQQNYFDSAALIKNFERIIKSLEPYLDVNLTDNIFVYLINNIEIDNNTLYQKLEEIPQILNTKIMSLYERWIQEGIEKGIEKGIEQGIEQGIEKTIKNAYKNGIDINTIKIITGESTEKINAILLKNGLQ